MYVPPSISVSESFSKRMTRNGRVQWTREARVWLHLEAVLGYVEEGDTERGHRGPVSTSYLERSVVFPLMKLAVLFVTLSTASTAMHQSPRVVSKLSTSIELTDVRSEVSPRFQGRSVSRWRNLQIHHLSAIV